MRFGGSMAAISIVATGFMVAGCSQVSSSSAAGGPASSSAAAAGAGAGGEPAPPAPAAPSGGAASPTAVAAGAGKCQPGDLALAFGAKSGTTQVVLAVDLTNKGT